MKKEWVKIYSTPYLYKAEIAKAVLEENEIVAIIINKQDSAYMTFGEIELYTLRDFVVKAIKLIENIKYE